MRYEPVVAGSRKSKVNTTSSSDQKAPPRIVANGAAALALAVKPRVAGDLLDCGLTRIYQLLNEGELESFSDGRSRKITTASIKAYIARKTAAAQAGKVA